METHVATPEEFAGKANSRVATLPDSGLQVIVRYAGDRAMLLGGGLRAAFDAQLDTLGIISGSAKDRKAAAEAEEAEDDDGQAALLRLFESNLRAREADARRAELLLGIILVRPAYADVKEHLSDIDAAFLVDSYGSLPAEEAAELDFTLAPSGSTEPSTS